VGVRIKYIINSTKIVLQIVPAHASEILSQGTALRNLTVDNEKLDKGYAKKNASSKLTIGRN
jgi:hypothetical protein